MIIEFAYGAGDFVKHRVEPTGGSGLVVAAMVRGQNHSYQVQWSAEKEACWHLDFELLLDETRPRQELGFRAKP